jgi:hypothetical protein
LNFLKLSGELFGKLNPFPNSDFLWNSDFWNSVLGEREKVRGLENDGSGGKGKRRKGKKGEKLGSSSVLKIRCGKAG